MIANLEPVVGEFTQDFFAHFLFRLAFGLAGQENGVLQFFQCFQGFEGAIFDALDLAAEDFDALIVEGFRGGSGK